MVKIKCCRKPIVLSDIWVSSHEKLSDFYASAWQRGDSAVPLLVLRLLLLVVGLAIMIWSIYEGFNWYWLMFLTNWGMLLVNAMLLSGVVVSFMAVLKKISDDGQLPWFVSLYWFLFNVSVSIAFVISALYWILLYSPEMKVLLPPRLYWLEVMTHGMNSCLMGLELLLSRTPVRLLHVYQPLGVGIWYAAFTGIYYLAGGTDGNGQPYIYEILDWRHSKRSAAIIGIAAVGLIVIYCFVYGAALIRYKLTALMFRTTTIKLISLPPSLQTSRNDFV